MLILILLAQFALFVTLLHLGHAFWSWVAPIALGLFVWALTGIASPILFGLAVILAAPVAVFFGFRPLRRAVLTRRLMPVLAKILPKMSETERAALEAGTVWWDADLFSGDPDWRKLLKFPIAPLSPRERAFLDGPVNEVCAMVQDWEVVKSGDLPGEVWDFLKKHGFFGMIIPEEHGGLGFSAQAHSAVVTRLASRSPALAVTVMVPNSLGPAELILHYGTPDQKRHYLPRLATGEDIPCFALTEPSAGSDAASIRSSGVVCRGEFNGREVLGMRLDWNKRYTTLAPVTTVIGLAFRLTDPEHLLGQVEDLGITCALVPADLPGVEIGPRHDPLGVPFMNGPCIGKDVFVPIDAIIGGPPMAGKGWGMLMQCLAAGRGISLPAMSTGGAQLAARTVGAFATVREQFNLPIGKFEGVEEPLARIGALTYVMDAVRRLTAGAIDAGEKPSVVTAIAKRYLTESMRTVINDAMDVLAGSGICLGPRNPLGGAYQAAPIGITVEGANILTRTMIIFGQGAIRCHPHAQKEMKAVAEDDLVAFDRELFKHLGFVAKNTMRSLVLGLSDGRASRPPVEGATARSFQRLSRMSAAFALVADVAMGTLGGSLKRREKLCGRLADALAWMYLASASLKRFQEEGATAVDAPYAQWCCEHALHEVQEALLGFLRNFPLRFLAGVVRVIVFPLGARYAPPSDRLGAEVARGLLDDNEPRRRLTTGIFVPDRSETGLGQLEEALEKVVRARPVQQKVREAVKAKRLAPGSGAELVQRALADGVLNAEEARVLQDGEKAREQALVVDSFPFAEYAELRS